VSQSGGGANPQGNATTTQVFTPPTTVTTQTQTRVPAVDLSAPTDFTLKTTAATGTAQTTIIIRGLDGALSSPNAILNLGNASTFLNDSVYGTQDANRQGTVQPLVGSPTTLEHTTTLVSLAANQQAAARPEGAGIGLFQQQFRKRPGGRSSRDGLAAEHQQQRPHPNGQPVQLLG